MFNSKFSQRIIKAMFSPKTFVINFEVKIGDNYFFVTQKVHSMFRSHAIEHSKKNLADSIKIIYKGSKSLGKTQPFNNELK